MRRLWMLEHSARWALLTLGCGFNAWLLCVVLTRAAGLPMVSAAVVAVLVTTALAAVVLAARARVPPASRLAQMLDQRAGASDLFASALEFQGEPERFGWLGELACEKAQVEAENAVLHAEWSFGPARRWAAVAGGAVLLCAAYVGVVVLESMDAAIEKGKAPGIDVRAGREFDRPDDEAAPDRETRLPAQDEVEAAEPEEPAEEAVKITTDMIDRYLQHLPEQQEIDLEGITPIRWDDDEVSGKANPQNQRREGEKIDPVRLDAALLKDLQAAKKTKAKEAGKQEGGVDVAVIGKETPARKAKGKKGGKDGKGSLADAVSRDPRGKPSRLATKPVRRGLPIRSAARSLVKQKGQERPMGLLEFLAAMKRARAALVAHDEKAAPQAAERAPERVVRQEPVPDAAAEVVESYFERLRRADR